MKKENLSRNILSDIVLGAMITTTLAWAGWVSLVVIGNSSEISSLTASVEDIPTMRQDVTQIKIDSAVTKDILSRIAPSWGINPAASEQRIRQEQNLPAATSTTVSLHEKAQP